MTKISFIKPSLFLTFLISCFSPITLASEQTLVTVADAKTSPAVFIEIAPKGNSLGDEYVFDQPLLDQAGKVIGSNSGFCLRTRLNHSLQCQWTLELARGSIQVQGREYDKGSSNIAIVGGTGDYRYISGEMVSVNNGDGTFTQTLYYRLPEGNLQHDNTDK